MASDRQIVLIPESRSDGADATLGSKRGLLDVLARFNTTPDGSPEHVGVAFGPGFRVELPFVDENDPITQALITITEDDNAWPVLFRMCSQMHWRLMDADSGRTFGP